MATEDALTERVTGEVCGHDMVIAGERRLILVHADLFEDHIFFHVEVGLSQGRLKKRGQQLESGLEVFGEHGSVVHRNFFAGRRVVLCADFVEDAVDVIR